MENIKNIQKYTVLFVINRQHCARLCQITIFSTITKHEFCQSYNIWSQIKRFPGIHFLNEFFSRYFPSLFRQCNSFKLETSQEVEHIQQSKKRRFGKETSTQSLKNSSTKHLCYHWRRVVGRAQSSAWSCDATQRLLCRLITHNHSPISTSNMQHQLRQKCLMLQKHTGMVEK